MASRPQQRRFSRRQTQRRTAYSAGAYLGAFVVTFGFSPTIADNVAANNAVEFGFAPTIADAVVDAGAAVEFGFSAALDESFDIVDTASVSVGFGATIDDAVVDAGASVSFGFAPSISDLWNDLATVTFGFSAALDESITINDTSSVSFGFGATIDDLVANVFDGTSLAFNAITGAASTYSNWDFNTVFNVGQTWYAADDSKLYTLSGTTDDTTNIAAKFRTGLMDFGTPNLKRIIDMVIGGESVNQLCVTIRVVENGAMEEYSYVSDTDANDPKELYVKPGKGMKSRYFALQVENELGGDFEVDRIDLYHQITSRKRNS